MLPIVRRLLLPLVVLVVLGSCLASSALADGSPSIAAAPLVAYGQQQFGNTATGAFVNAGTFCYRSYWTLPVTAGDHVTIDWESNADDTMLLVLPLGTTDFTVDQVIDQTGDSSQSLAPSGRNQLLLTASASGSMPVLFSSECAGPTGPYDFTAYVHHAVRLSLPAVSAVRRRVTLSIPVHNAEGGVISDPGLLVEVQLKAGRSWIGVGSAPVANSVAAVPLNIPLRYVGKIMKLRAVARGGSYLDAASSSQRVLITMRPKPGPRARRKSHQRQRSRRGEK